MLTPPSPRDLLLRNARSRTRPFGETFAQGKKPRTTDLQRITTGAGSLRDVIARTGSPPLRRKKLPTAADWPDIDRLARANRNQDPSKIKFRYQ